MPRLRAQRCRKQFSTRPAPVGARPLPAPPARPLTPLLLLLCASVAACADPAPPPPAAARPPATAAAEPATAAPAGPVTSFDGRYVGVMTLNPDRTRRCADAPRQELEITVRQGRATFMVNPTTRQTLSGTVGRDGTVRMTDLVDRSVATSGVFTPQAFVGEFRNQLCSYAVSFRRPG